MKSWWWIYESDAAALATAVDGHRLQTVPRADNLGFAVGVNLAAARDPVALSAAPQPGHRDRHALVRVLESWMVAHPEVGVTGARVFNANGSVQPSARRFPDLTTLFGGRSTWLTSRFPSNWFSRRNLVGLDSDVPVDVDWISGRLFHDVQERVRSHARFRRGLLPVLGGCRLLSPRRRRRLPPDVCANGVSAPRRRLGPADSLARAIRAFHRSAFRMYWKHASWLGRLPAPAIWAGLWLRGEIKIRREVSRADGRKSNAFSRRLIATSRLPSSATTRPSPRAGCPAPRAACATTPAGRPAPRALPRKPRP